MSLMTLFATLPGTPMRILLVKPYQNAVAPICQPPLGLLYLAATLRSRFERQVDVEIRDLRLQETDPAKFAESLDGNDYDLVGISAMNFEAEATHELARSLRAAGCQSVLAVGGPYAHSSRQRITDSGDFDLVFDGEADWTFPDTVAVLADGNIGNLSRIPGLTWRSPDGEMTWNGPAEPVADLDEIPFPAWDLVDFAEYARKPNQMGWKRGKLYAPIFTSRGCPYKCNYCHDLFGKKFRWRSAENVLAEIELLANSYDIDEFQIIDDIFNLHKPRMRQIANGVIERFGEEQLLFCFPNGIRADIIDVDDVPLLKKMGVYQAAIAIETTTDRLQNYIEKHLDILQARKVVDACDRAGILTKGFFMIGFPTQTVDEILETIDYAIKAPFTFAGFYLVIPQEGTPIYDLAARESLTALDQVRTEDFYARFSWYQLAYGVDLHRIQKRAFRQFYLRPRRMWRIARSVSPGSLIEGFLTFLKIAVRMDPIIGRRALQKTIRTHDVPQTATAQQLLEAAAASTTDEQDQAAVA